MPNVSAEESLLLQCLATTSLLGELSNAKFLESDYYKRLAFGNGEIKKGSYNIRAWESGNNANDVVCIADHSKGNLIKNSV